MKDTLHELLDFANKTALKAGKMLLEFRKSPLKFSYKDGIGNLVTHADIQTEEYIIKSIKKAYPTHDIIAEESGKNVSGSEYVWHIDPLDGTTNYFHNFPFYCTSIGLEHRGKIIVGVIFNPRLNEHFWAASGHGAFLNGKKIHVSSNSKLEKSLFATGFPYKKDTHEFKLATEITTNIQRKVHGIRRAGSAALDLCYTAGGVFDGYYEMGLNSWDITAGICILHEAGGKVTNFDGTPIDIHGANLVASNGKIHKKLLDLLKIN